MDAIAGVDFNGGFRCLALWALREAGVQDNVAWNRGLAIILRGSDCALVGSQVVGDQHQKGGGARIASGHNLKLCNGTRFAASRS